MRLGARGFDQGPHPRVRRAEVVEPRRRDELAAATETAGGLNRMRHDVPAEEVGRGDPDLFAEVAAEVARGVTQPPERLECSCRFRVSPSFCSRSRWIASCATPCEGCRVVEETGLDLVAALSPPLSAHRDPAGEAEVPVQPRVEQRPAVDLHAQRLPAGLEAIGVGLDPKVGAVGVRPDDTEPGSGTRPSGIRPPRVPRDERAAPDEEVGAARSGTARTRPPR